MASFTPHGAATGAYLPAAAVACLLLALGGLIVGAGILRLHQNLGRRLGAAVLLLDLFLSIVWMFFGIGCCFAVLNAAFDLFALKMLYQDHSQAFEVW